MHTIIGLLFVIAAVYFGLCGYLYFNQRALIYFPTPEVELQDSKYIRVSSAGESIKLWVINEGKPQAVLYFGGNAAGVENNIPQFTQIFTDYSVYLVNYRGYGGSTGQPSENGLYTDAISVYDEIKTRHTSIAVIGRSLGSGVATYLAANREVDKLVLITPYDSMVNVAKSAYPLFPVSLLLRDRFDSVSRVAAISAQTLLIIAERDEIIPRRSSEALAEVFPAQQITKTVIPDQYHNTFTTHQNYIAALKTFFAQ